MTIDIAAPRSRRAMLAASFGAAAATVASLVGRPAPARAANGDTIVLGVTASTGTGAGPNEATAATHIYTTSGYGLSALTDASSFAGLAGWAGYSSGGAYGVFGQANGYGAGVYGYAQRASGSTYGVYGLTDSTGGTGVYGLATAESGTAYGVAGECASADGAAVYADSTSGSGDTFGVLAYCASTTGIGVRGHATANSGAVCGVLGRVGSTDGTGVLGYSGSGFDPAPSPKTGVYGYAAQDADSRGVYGRSVAGRGVYGQASTGQGVRGYSATGAAGYFSTSGLKKGAAIRAVGRVRLDNCAGVATVLSGQTSVTVTPGIDISGSSAIVATVMSDSATTLAIRRVSTDTVADTFTIHISGTAPVAGLKVAWHVFG